MTGRAARENANNVARLAKATASELRVPLDDMPGRVAALLDERKRLERELSETKKKLAMGGGGKAEDGDGGIENVDGVKLMAKTLSGVDAKDLRSLADEGKKKLGSGVVALIASTPKARRRWSSASPPTSPLPTMPCSWCRPASPRSAAKAAAAAPIWRRAAVRMAARPRRRWQRSKSW